MPFEVAKRVSECMTADKQVTRAHVNNVINSSVQQRAGGAKTSGTGVPVNDTPERGLTSLRCTNSQEQKGKKKEKNPNI